MTEHIIRAMIYGAEGWDMERYERQMHVFGEDGQEMIRDAVIGIIGCGGLGTNVATALASAGVHHMVIMDPDCPEESNLNRQYVYCQEVRNGNPRPKAVILAEWIRNIDPEIQVEAHVCRFSAEAEELFAQCDILVDCLDSVAGRMDLNRYAVASGKPLVHGGIDGFIGEVAACIPGRTPCLRCMMGDLRDSGRTPASIGAVVSTVGSMEAAEVLKILTGRGATEGLFLSLDLNDWRFQRIRFERDPDCPVCGHRS